MLVQDLDGQLYEAPDEALDGYAEEDMAYDGFGNPVGFPPLIPILTSLAPMVLPPLMKALSSGFKGPEDDLYGYGEDPEDLYGYGEDPEDLYGYGEEEVMYDGFGNPVGFPALIPAIGSLIPGAVKAVGGLVRGLTSGGRRSRSAALVRAAQARALAARRRAAAYATRRRPPYRMPHRRFPHRAPGWIRRPSPYTGTGPRRMYMRCATWPGPAGLVPASAASGRPMAPRRPRRRRRRRRSRRRRY